MVCGNTLPMEKLMGIQVQICSFFVDATLDITMFLFVFLLQTHYARHIVT